MLDGLDLANAPLNTSLTLVSVTTAPSSRLRLTTLGIREGAKVTLLTRTISGGRIALVAGSRIALGRDLLRDLHAQVA